MDEEIGREPETDTSAPTPEPSAAELRERLKEQERAERERAKAEKKERKEREKAEEKARKAEERERAKAEREQARAQEPDPADVVYNLAIKKYRLARDEAGTPILIPRAGGPSRALKEMKGALTSLFKKSVGSVPPPGAVAMAIETLAGEAEELPRETCYVRVAPREGRMYLDLGRSDGTCVEIDSTGWRVLDVAPVPFRRTELTGEMPIPTRGGTLDAMREIINVDGLTWPLCVGWLLAALDPDAAHPVLQLGGPQDAGKTTAGRLLTSLIDPSPGNPRSMPEKEQDWSVTAAASWSICVDNTDALPKWFSNALCKAVTGDAYVCRTLFENSKVTVLKFRRAVVLTTIDPGVLRGDLASRVVEITLTSIPKEKRLSEQEIDARFAKAWPELLGALLDLMVQVLQIIGAGTLPRPESRLTRYEEILSALDVLWGRVEREAIDSIMWPSAVGTYRRSGERIAADVIEGSDVATELLHHFFEVVEEGGRHIYRLRPNRAPLVGTSEKLRLDLRVMAELRRGGVERLEGWPKWPQTFRGALARVAPALRQSGIEVTFPDPRRGGGKTPRVITIRPL